MFPGTLQRNSRCRWQKCRQESTMKFLAMATVVLSVAATAALANPDPATTGNPPTKAAVTAPAAEGSIVMARRYHRYYGARRCLERLGYGRTGSYGCG
jgi:hypothetical protein